MAAEKTTWHGSKQAPSSSCGGPSPIPRRSRDRENLDELFERHGIRLGRGGLGLRCCAQHSVHEAVLNLASQYRRKERWRKKKDQILFIRQADSRFPLDRLVGMGISWLVIASSCHHRQPTTDHRQQTGKPKSNDKSTVQPAITQTPVEPPGIKCTQQPTPVVCSRPPPLPEPSP